VVSGALRRVSPGLVGEIAAAGHGIGIHGRLHRPPLQRGPRATYDDLARARDTVPTSQEPGPHSSGPRTA